MGSIFRSEEMQLSQVFLHTDIAHMCISELGELGLVQFRDSAAGTSAFQRKFVNEVRRCDEMERKLRFLEKEIEKDKFPILDTGENPEAPAPREIIDLEGIFEKLENELKEVNSSAEELTKAHIKLSELKQILRKTQIFFEECEGLSTERFTLPSNDLPLRRLGRTQALHDPAMTEENVGLLGGEGMAAGGLRLGWVLADADHFLITSTDQTFEAGSMGIRTTDQRRPLDIYATFTHGMHFAMFLHEVICGLFLENFWSVAALFRLFFRSLAGVIHRDRLPAFERMLWRACRGNVFLKQAEIDEPLEDPATGTKVNKSVFLVFFQGDQLRTRVKKICEGFHASISPCPDSQVDRRNMAIEVIGKIEDLETVLTQTKQHRQRILETAAKNLRVWFIKVRKIKAIYHTLNLFNLDVTTKCMVGECWCAVNDVDKIHLALRRGMERSNSTLQPILNGVAIRESPPTYHRTNKFTAAFQNIIDAYGVARYREVNPAMFTVITFPFLFGVMFGDAGHGLLMFLFALWMVLSERKLMAKKSGGEVWNTFFGGRYIILLMGIFSVYTGLIYNDVFSRSLNIFGSSWYPTYDSATLVVNDALQLEPGTVNQTTDRMFAGYPYPFGLDPVWQLATNKIMLTNSIKMKMSIILGVLHMLIGICLGAFNYRFFNEPLAIWCELIPQILFLSSIFVYLILLVFYKWIVYGAEQAGTAPSLLINLINMVRFSYNNDGPPSTRTFYSGQQTVQTILMVIAVLSVPWMLLTKPLILLMRHRAIAKHAARRGLVDSRDNTFVDLGGLTNAGMVEDHINGGGDSNGVGYHDTTPLHASSSRLSKTSNLSDTDSPSVGNYNEKGLGANPLDKESNLSSEKIVVNDGLQSGAFNDSVDMNEEPFDFGDIMIYQAIHTIEFCLGCISNTASYLRLWALSLAHAQLSEVLWTMVLHNGLNAKGYYGGILLVFVFFFWACLTISILLLMEGLSAFLHTLRLHWVEFQNKFYKGDGYPFTPFSFDHCLNMKSEV
ncbi:V-type H+-transporting ATPase subunit a [Paragonimus westermani]|uniref:V-type H+-transporting ATPase subunit a n=1 Tax=Paragonimus westermani TaxID=34504 RepID=A0A5J4NCP7_9TREM|nr:V-type H+-transporting ATPase subunit a [Paragonimus westermani]